MESKLLRGLLAAGLLAVVTTANSSVQIVDVTGIRSNDSLGSATNEVRTFNIGPNAHVTGIAWDVELYADSPSWLSEISVQVSPSSGGGFTASPGFSADNSGTATFTSPFLDLVGLGVDFNVLADGILKLEFFETFDDFTAPPPDNWDGIWNKGTLSIQFDAESAVPEPATLALLGIGLAGLGFARRKQLPISHTNGNPGKGH